MFQSTVAKPVLFILLDHSSPRVPENQRVLVQVEGYLASDGAEQRDLLLDLPQRHVDGAVRPRAPDARAAVDDDGRGLEVSCLSVVVDDVDEVDDGVVVSGNPVVRPPAVLEVVEELGNAFSRLLE